MDKKRIYLSSPTMTGAEQEYIKEAFDTNWVAPLGQNVNEFEKELASYVGVPFAAALTSGTAAMHMAIKALGIKRGDIVFCSSLTFAASCNPIVYEGGIPVFIDSEEDSWNMDPAALRKAFAKYPNVKAVIVVNLYGTPAKLDEIAAICREHGVPLIEDAAESLGATYRGRQTGTFGKFGVFSFNGNKIITTSGGGMLVSEDRAMIEKVRFWATQAREKELHYEHKEIGYNYRMSNIVAGIGRGQLKSLNDFIQRKKQIYNTYKDVFKDIDYVSMNPVPEDCEPNYWLSCITIKESCKVKPYDIIKALEKENIESRPVWKPMHLQPVYRECDFISMVDDPLGISGRIFSRGLCLPSDIKMTKEDMDRIIYIVKEMLEVG
ncbi:MAG TPA: aminotransferase class I/II-fold pyridoxal phosphate-dependent enzyme [Mobilitalea sp.]|nr:aminotransferase class I/II-fold pyridoxal phosphate-dependent enzyme [Acetivibrio sp.]HPU62991.1 aminotransferase class I/II-fold pyridoxal phosphate-dependent enzyme [Mobilitalea sp.]